MAVARFGEFPVEGRGEMMELKHWKGNTNAQVKKQISEMCDSQVEISFFRMGALPWVLVNKGMNDVWEMLHDELEKRVRKRQRQR